MTTTNDFTARLFAGFAAVAMTLTLLTGYFATPQAAAFTGILA